MLVCTSDYDVLSSSPVWAYIAAITHGMKYEVLCHNCDLKCDIGVFPSVILAMHNAEVMLNGA
jgi:hypothetical protein